MEGYSTKLGKMVEMQDVQTVQLTDQSFVHKGFYYHDDGKKRRREVIYRKIYDSQIIVSRPGHYFPAEVYVGKDTPKALIEQYHGQIIIKEDVRIQTDPKEGGIKTLETLKKEIRDEK